MSKSFLQFSWEFSQDFFLNYFWIYLIHKLMTLKNQKCLWWNIQLHNYTKQVKTRQHPLYVLVVQIQIWEKGSLTKSED